MQGEYVYLVESSNTQESIIECVQNELDLIQEDLDVMYDELSTLEEACGSDEKLEEDVQANIASFRIKAQEQIDAINKKIEQMMEKYKNIDDAAAKNTIKGQVISLRRQIESIREKTKATIDRVSSRNG